MKKKNQLCDRLGYTLLHCYAFWLRNARATHQRLVNKMLKNQINHTVEVYVDDILVKSKSQVDPVDDLRNTFEILKKYRIKLNPKKCVFRVSTGKFAGFIVNHRGIRANPDKI